MGSSTGHGDDQYYIPVIDVLDFPAQAEKLIAACEEWGCFRIINHGIPEALMAEMNSVPQSFFDRPLEIKQRNANAIADRGYIINKGLPLHEGIGPLYEGMGAYDSASPGALDTFCDQLEASPHQRCSLSLSLSTTCIHYFILMDYIYIYIYTLFMGLFIN